MLEQYSWPQFLLVALVMSLIWYIAVLLLYFRREMEVFFCGSGRAQGSSQGKDSVALPRHWDGQTDQLSDGDLAGGARERERAGAQEDDLMGKSRLPQGMSLVRTGEISFTASGSGSDEVGLVPDVLEEVKAVFYILIKENGDKREFFKLMEAVREEFPGISSHPGIGKINSYIRDHASFHLSSEELENLWD